MLYTLNFYSALCKYLNKIVIKIKCKISQFFSSIYKPYGRKTTKCLKMIFLQLRWEWNDRFRMDYFCMLYTSNVEYFE